MIPSRNLSHFKIKRFALLLITLLSIPGLAESIAELSFIDALKLASQHSQAILSSRSKAESYQEQSQRAQHYWTPLIYIDGRGFSTNDPGMSLFSKINEKTISSSDFNSSSLTSPEIQTHYRLTAGAELTLYEGGSKLALADYFGNLAKGQTEETKSVLNQEQARVFESYSRLIITNQRIQALESVKSVTTDLLKNYKLSNTNNPIGRSGALGIRNILNRLNTEISLSELEKNSIIISLSKIWNFPTQWKPTSTSVLNLENEIKNKLNYSAQESSQYRSLQNFLSAQQEMSLAKKAIYKPRIGLFGESYAYSNNNNSANANSYMVGAYVHWNLWSQEHYGVTKESELQTGSLQAQTSLALQATESELKSNQEMIPLLIKQVQVMNESLEMMHEQAHISKNLFQNGALNVLQLVEVYNRLTDLIGKKSDLEQKLAQTISSTIAHTGVEIHDTK